MSAREIFLHVDDCEDDVFLSRFALSKASLANQLYDVCSGDEAILYLCGEGKYQNREKFPLPTVVLLDLLMPGKSGFDVLEWVKGQASFRNVCFIVLTGSERIEYIHRAYQLGASSVLAKPLDGQRVLELLQTVERVRQRENS